MISTYISFFTIFKMIPFFFKTQWNLYKCSIKANRFHLKMEIGKMLKMETAVAIVALLPAKEVRKREKDPYG